MCKGRNAFCRVRQCLAEQERALLHTERRAVPLLCLPWSSMLQPNLTTDRTMIMVSIHEQDAITNRREICSLQFGHFCAGTPGHGPHMVRSHSACMDVQSFQGAPVQYGRPVLFCSSLQKASLDASRVFTCPVCHSCAF